jgi:alpha-tubulin suppressor-like RCC1 family protein
MIFSTQCAFAALLKNGEVCTWGSAIYGEEPIRCRFDPNLQNVKIIFSTNTAFAALLTDGSVSTWGCHRQGGLIPWVIKNELFNILTIYPTKYGFTALRDDGKIFSWGDYWLTPKLN